MPLEKSTTPVPYAGSCYLSAVCGQDKGIVKLTTIVQTLGRHARDLGKETGLIPGCGVYQKARAPPFNMCKPCKADSWMA